MRTARFTTWMWLLASLCMTGCLVEPGLDEPQSGLEPAPLWAATDGGPSFDAGTPDAGPDAGTEPPPDPQCWYYTPCPLPPSSGPLLTCPALPSTTTAFSEEATGTSSAALMAGDAGTGDGGSRYPDSSCYNTLSASDQVLYGMCKTTYDVVTTPIPDPTDPCSYCDKLSPVFKPLCQEACKKLTPCNGLKDIIGDRVCCDQLKNTQVPLTTCKEYFQQNPSSGLNTCLDCCDRLADRGEVNDTNRQRCKAQCNYANDRM